MKNSSKVSPLPQQPSSLIERINKAKRTFETSINQLGEHDENEITFIKVAIYILYNAATNLKVISADTARIANIEALIDISNSYKFYQQTQAMKGIVESLQSEIYAIKHQEMAPPSEIGRISLFLANARALRDQEEPEAPTVGFFGRIAQGIIAMFTPPEETINKSRANRTEEDIEPSWAELILSPTPYSDRYFDDSYEGSNRI